MRAGKHRPGYFRDRDTEIVICDNCSRNIPEYHVWIDLRQEFTKGKEFCGMNCDIEFIINKGGRVFRGWREG